MLLHADDSLVCCENAESMLRNVTFKCFKLNEYSFGPPHIYLSGSTGKVELDNGVEVWEFSSNHNVKAAVHNVKYRLQKLDKELPSRVETNIRTESRTYLDVLPKLALQEVSYC